MTAITVLKPQKRVHHWWSMYDWANSAYNLVITSTIFPAYYDAVTSVKKDNAIVQDQVSFFGWELSNSALFMYALSFAYLVICLLSPLLSSIADLKGNKNKFLLFFCGMGALACMVLYFFTGAQLELGILSFVIATIGYCGSLVFYNAYLPEISTVDQRDRLSARGFTYGYIGSFILQIICFIFVMQPEWFGQDAAWGSRFSFFLVGVWWLFFGWLSVHNLPRNSLSRENKRMNILTNGFLELKKVAQQVNNIPVLQYFLIAFLFYSMGVQTVMLAATLFGTKELSLSTDQLIITILIIQLVAILGAYLMSRLSALFGNIRVLVFTVIIWIGICIAAYFVHTAMHFYIIASVVGLVMGGIQSLSRSTYSKLMPKTKDTASFFSFYDITEKVAIVIGMFSFGFIDQMSGSMRNSIVALVIFFLIGLILLLWTQEKSKAIFQTSDS